jgi:hypothetical protein
MTSKFDAYEDGYDAQVRGHSHETNPHAEGSWLWVAWRYGYARALLGEITLIETGNRDRQTGRYYANGEMPVRPMLG